jgi:hypothetical protein
MLNGSGMFGIDFWTPKRRGERRFGLPRTSGPIRRGSIDALSDLRGDVSGGGLGDQTAVEHLTRKMS